MVKTGMVNVAICLAPSAEMLVIARAPFSIGFLTNCCWLLAAGWAVNL
jgi:hypothetical protein